jgi:predicted PurR-regulated permease PerM
MVERYVERRNIERNKKMNKSKKDKARFGACIALIIIGIIVGLIALFNGLGILMNILSPVVVGAVLAYVMCPLTNLLERTILKKLPEGLKKVLSIVLAVLLLLAIVLFFLLLVIPQLIITIRDMIGNIGTYKDEIEGFLYGVSEKTGIDLSQVYVWLEQFRENLPVWLKEHAAQLLQLSKSAGDTIVNVGLGFTLAIYFLADKMGILNAVKRFFKAILPDKRYPGFSRTVQRTHSILTRYIIAELVDALIVGLACALLMIIGQMPFVALIAFVMGVMNLIPTFGPVIGSVFGTFLILLHDPMKALIFLAVMAVIHAVDGYILKPKLFGSALGVSPVLVFASVIIGGRILGVWGMLLAIPVAAIISFLMNDLMTYLEKKKGQKAETEPVPAEGKNTSDTEKGN